MYKMCRIFLHLFSVMLSLNIANASIKNLKKNDQETNKVGKFLIVANGNFNKDLVKKILKIA